MVRRREPPLSTDMLRDTARNHWNVHIHTPIHRFVQLTAIVYVSVSILCTLYRSLLTLMEFPYQENEGRKVFILVFFSLDIKLKYESANQRKI